MRLLALLALTDDRDPKRVLDNIKGLRHDLELRLGARTGMPNYDQVRELVGFLNNSPLLAQLNELRQHVALISRTQREVQDAMYAFLVAESLDLNTATTPLPRFIPVRLYVSGSDWSAAKDIANAAVDVAEQVGFFGQVAYSRESGSWFVTWFSRSKDVLSQPEVVERLKKVERALELQTLATPQAIADEKVTQAVARLIEAARSEPNMALQLGSLLFVKMTDAQGPRIFSRTLTQKEMIAIEANHGLLRDPSGLLKVLDALRDSQDSPPSQRRIELQ